MHKHMLKGLHDNYATAGKAFWYQSLHLKPTFFILAEYHIKTKHDNMCILPKII